MMTTSLLSDQPKCAGATPTLDMPKVKLLVLGEAGVGKTALVQAVAGTPVKQSPWTVGTSIELLIHSYKAGTPQEMAYFIELWDIGGSRSHRNARRVFYQNVNGIILVHDMTNRKSEQNLRNWLAEVFQPDAALHASQSPMTYGLGNSNNSYSVFSLFLVVAEAAQSYEIFRLVCDAFRHLPQSVFDAEQLMGNSQAVPMLFVGAKLDQISMPSSTSSSPMPNSSPPSLTPNKTNSPKSSYQSKLAQECGCEELWLDCRQPISPGSTNSVKLNRFFDRVIEKYETTKQSRSGSVLTPTGAHHATMAERRRKLAFM